MKLDKKSNKKNVEETSKPENFCSNCNKLQVEVTSLRIENAQIKQELEALNISNKNRKSYLVLFPHDVDPYNMIRVYDGELSNDEIQRILRNYPPPLKIFIDAKEYIDRR